MLKIKVGDLLHNIGTKDTVKLEGIKTDLLPEITKEGIFGQVELQSLNDTTILCTLQNISATAKNISDISLQEFERKIVCPNYKVNFLLNFDKNSENVYDEEFPIDEKNLTIDLEEVLYHCIKLQEPTILLAKGEELK